MHRLPPRSLVLGCSVLLLLASCGGGGGPDGGPLVAEPASGFTAGGETIRLHGSGFGAPGSGLEVLVGGAPASDVAVVDDGLLVFTLPPGNAGTTSIRIAGSNREAAFTYYRYPPVLADGDLRISSGPAGSARSGSVDAARDGDVVVAVWKDQRNGEDDVYLNRSLDGGVTWLADDVRVDTGEASSLGPQVCVSGTHVVVAWVEEDGDWDDVLVRASHDAGDTWDPVVRLNERVLDEGAWGPRIACTGETVYVTWEFGHHAHYDVEVAVSRDAGASWEEAVRLDPGPAFSASSGDPKVCCEGDHAYVCWTEARATETGVDLRVTRDRGRTWEPAVEIDAPLGAPSSATSTWVACDGAAVHVVWSDWLNGRPDIYVRSSHDRGTTWSASAPRLDEGPLGGEDSYSPHVACQGEHVCVVWTDWRRGDADVYVRASDDGGTTWGTGEVRLNPLLPAGAGAQGPELACCGACVYVTWSDERDGSPDVYLGVSTDGGLTWPTPPLRVDDNPAGTVLTLEPQVLCDGAAVAVVWTDSRDGEPDVYAEATRP